MAERKRPPYEPKLVKQERKALAKQVRATLVANPLNLGEIADALGIEPEVVVIALRELRARKRGRLRSTIRVGHVSWWWELPAETESPAGKKSKKKGK